MKDLADTRDERHGESDHADDARDAHDVARTNERVRSSFAHVASNYRRSRRHGDPASLRAMLALIQPRGDERVLDVATGGGHTAAALAPFVRSVVASDLLEEMLVQARVLLAEAQVRNASVAAADVHALPFAAGAFDLVTVRCAPHHFADLAAACGEIARCLRPGGRFYLNDCGTPPDPDAASFVDEVERLRDPSHVKACGLREWRRTLEATGLVVDVLRELPSSYDVPAWLAHLECSAETRAAVLTRLSEAPESVRRFVGIDTTPGHEVFTTLRVEGLATKPE